MTSDAPIDTGPVKTNPFLFAIAGDGEGPPGLKATHCRDCGGFTLGRVMICAQCFSRAVEPSIAGRAATLVEHSIAHHPAGGFDAPYAIGLVRTVEGLTLFAPLTGGTERLAPGLALVFTTVTRDGNQVGFAFEPQETDIVA